MLIQDGKASAPAAVVRDVVCEVCSRNFRRERVTRQDISVLMRGGVSSEVPPNAYSVKDGSGVEEVWQCTDVYHKADIATLDHVRIQPKKYSNRLSAIVGNSLTTHFATRTRK